VDVSRVAIPLPLSVPLPSGVLLSLNATVPVGAGPLVLVTVAAKVTAEPTVAFALLEPIMVRVVACCMTSLTTLDCAAASVASPAYCAERLWVAAESWVVENVATPLAFRFALPMAVVPS